MEKQVFTASFPVIEEDKQEAERGADRRCYYATVGDALRVVPRALHILAWFRLEERGWFDYRLGGLRTFIEVVPESEPHPDRELRSFDNFRHAFEHVCCIGVPLHVSIDGAIWKLYPTGRAERRPS